jgi:uncharacterized heparinase superfamily protein
VRINRLFKKLFFSSNFYDLYLTKHPIQDIIFTPKDAWPGDPLLGDSLVQGHYDLAGKKIYAPDEILWKIIEPSNYWKKEIHSFSWLRHLKARSGSLARKHARFLIIEWLQLYSKWNEKTWEIETLSRRLSSWITNIDFLLAEKDEKLLELLKKNIFKQIKHLRLHANKNYFSSLDTEYTLEISSIKKIKILRGLLLYNICFEEEGKRYIKYIKMLALEVLLTFNSEGLHFSKSPSTQLSILADLVTIREALISKQLKVPDFLSIIIKKSAHSLRFFRTSNGCFAIFNGSKQETKFLIDKILSIADGKSRARGPSSLFESGFEKLNSSDLTVFVDTFKYNNKSSSYAPHAIEVNVGKNRMLGSCGTTFEKDKKWKTSLFSAAAHSALIIENSNPFYLKDKDQKINCRRYKKNGGEVLQSVHYGYKNRYSAICSRTIELGNNGKDFAVLDQIYSEKLLNFAIRLHFNPDIKISLSRDKKKSMLILNEQGWSFYFDGKALLTLEPSIFVTDTGKVVDTNQIVLRGETIKENTEILWGFNKET